MEVSLFSQQVALPVWRRPRWNDEEVFILIRLKLTPFLRRQETSGGDKRPSLFLPCQLCESLRRHFTTTNMGQAWGEKQQFRPIIRIRILSCASDAENTPSTPPFLYETQKVLFNNSGLFGAPQVAKMKRLLVTKVVMSNSFLTDMILIPSGTQPQFTRSPPWLLN